MPYTDGGERIDTPSVPYQTIPLETGDMKPPLMPGARLAAEPPPKVVLPPAPETLDCPCPSCMETKEAVEAEREACAKLCDHLAATFIAAAKGPVPGYMLDQFARAIRARG